jgi:16S rRNA (cytidine1402-2'-O)-methyltransferase
VVIARELTKKFEEITRGTPEEIKVSLQSRKVKGELVVLIQGRKE